MSAGAGTDHATVLTGARAGQDGDHPTHRAFIRRPDAGRGECAGGADTRCTAEEVAHNGIKRHNLPVARPDVLEVVVCVVDVLAVAARVVVNVVPPRHLGAARADRVVLEDHLLDIVKPMRSVGIPQRVPSDDTIHRAATLVQAMSAGMDDNPSSQQVVLIYLVVIVAVQIDHLPDTTPCELTPKQICHINP